MTAKADRIHALLEDKDLKEAFKTVREYYRDLIESTPIDSSNPEPLMDIRKMLKALGDVEQALHAAIQDGHLEDFRAHEQERLDVH